MDRGAGNYGSLVSLMRKQARQTAAELGRKFVITDGPGGNGSPVVASIQGAEQLLVLAEPTLASRAAMVRTVALAQ
jgi:MinD superfamily P-loop ATPase